ncbi:hypothetical protein DPMN_042063 [Dreissena polymorpha]|uniref:Uncharacterized protein n=1 Tax=Dreissena polymorpha TaxID=45954 RepID=A0A9D4D1B5_DREPO|nr:hypothetical protein DPMN_042063 [Dreissena polymorpha]
MSKVRVPESRILFARLQRILTNDRLSGWLEQTITGTAAPERNGCIRTERLHKKGNGCNRAGTSAIERSTELERLH